MQLTVNGVDPLYLGTDDYFVERKDAPLDEFGEKDFVDTYVDGADDMIGVILVIAIARGASVLMGVTYLDNYIIYNAADLLAKMPEMLFVPLNYILHIKLSILVPSSSGLATLSTPIIGPLASQLGYSVETTVMTLVAANGLVNLITPKLKPGLTIGKHKIPIDDAILHKVEQYGFDRENVLKL